MTFQAGNTAPDGHTPRLVAVAFLVNSHLLDIAVDAVDLHPLTVSPIDAALGKATLVHSGGRKKNWRIVLVELVATLDQ